MSDNRDPEIIADIVMDIKSDPKLCALERDLALQVARFIYDLLLPSDLRRMYPIGEKVEDEQ